MATPAAAPAPTPREPVEYAPLVRSEVVTSGRHGGSTAGSGAATVATGGHDFAAYQGSVLHGFTGCRGRSRSWRCHGRI
ncbi:hypothetical protein, partial [Aeromonas caviae]|uniref:hypothetical protein n=1 Tax=Aeromonas caviae TaxID=648 RepID=UPI001C1F5B13